MPNKPTEEALIALCGLSFPHITAKTAINNGDLLVGGKFVVGRSFKNIEYDTNNIAWDELLTQLHPENIVDADMLSPIYILALAYSSSGEVEYLDVALRLVKTWGKYEQVATERSLSIWTPRVAAARVAALVMLSIMQERTTSALGPWLVERLQEHCVWLAEKENYSKNRNECILMDFALIIAGAYLNEAEVMAFGSMRLGLQLAFVFPNKTAYRYNSSRQHIDMLWRLFYPLYYFEKFNLPDTDMINKYKSGAAEFATYLMTPTADVPAIGESPMGFFQATTGTLRECNKLGHKTLSYALSHGAAGEKPADTHKIYQADGYAFLRSSWEKESFANATWICFKAGYMATQHKHKDELSIIFTALGLNIFVDPGMGDPGSVSHNYLRSSFAHNGIIVDNKSYPLGRQTYMTGLFKTSYLAKDGSNFAIVGGYNNLYHGVCIDRTIIYANEFEFYIIDDIQSEEEHVYTQNFHLSNEVKLLRHTSRGTTVALPGTGHKMVIHQLDDTSLTTTHIAGGADDNKRSISNISILSTKNGEITNSTSIRYTKKGTNARFITKINIVKEDEVAEYSGPMVGNKLPIFNDEIDISPRKRAKPISIGASHVDGMLEINFAESQNSLAFVIFDAVTGQQVLATKYAKAPPIGQQLPDGMYVLRVKMRLPCGETIMWLAGEIKLSDDQFEFTQTPSEQAIPYIRKQGITCDEGIYAYTLKIDGLTGKYSVAWSVSKNGQPHFSARGGNKLIFPHGEPGKYACKYRVITAYFGEIDAGEFEVTVL